MGTSTKGTETAPGPATGSPVEVGYAYLKNLKAFAAAFGASADPGNQLAYIKAAVAWANAHGGLQGHRITPVYYGVDATSTTPYAQTAQAGCDFFTQDHHVVAVIVVGIDAPAQLPDCLTRRKVFYTVSDHALHDTADYRSLGYMVTPAEVGLDRAMRALVAQAAAQGLLAGGSKAGLLYADLPSAKRTLTSVIAPALKARKVGLVSYAVTPPASTAELENSESQIQSAVLRMKTEGVTTVTFMCPNCMTQFMQAADSQKYYPRYVYSSLDSPAGLTGSATPQQLVGSLGISWEPDRDVDTYADKKAFTGNPTRDLCTTIEKDADAINSGLRVFTSQAYCDATLLVHAAAAAAPPGVVTGSLLLTGANSLGTTHPSALTFSTRLTPSQRDGVSGFRTMKYSSDCDCLSYANLTVRPIPE